MSKQGFGDLKFVSEFADYFTQYTDMRIDLHYIRHDALFDRSLSGKITIAQDIKFSEARRVLYAENSIFKNSIEAKNRENVYFSYSKNNESFNIAFVDDIEKICWFMQKKHFCLVQSSDKKYQGYFLLDRYVNSDELYKIQKVLQETYKGDKGALSAFQLKRLVGFINTKYDDNFVVRVVFKGDSILNADSVLQYYENNLKPKQAINREPKSVDKDLKCWQDFNKTSDKSQVDMSYAVYLVRMGLDEDEIYGKLLKESEGIQERKGKYIDDYIERTIAKAINYVYNNSW